MVAVVVILACLLMLGFVRFGIRAAGTAGGKFKLRLRAGFLRFDVMKLIEKYEDKHEKSKRKKAGKTKKRPLPAAAIKALPGAASPVLRTLRKGLRVDRLCLKLTLTGQNDPCAAALMYGRLHMVCGIVMPLIEENFRVRKRRVEIGLSFEEDKTLWEADMAVSISAARLTAVMLVFVSSLIKIRKAG
jgi:hypothetical protein